jgi:hypothetical protein
MVRQCIAVEQILDTPSPKARAATLLTDSEFCLILSNPFDYNDDNEGMKISPRGSPFVKLRQHVN